MNYKKLGKILGKIMILEGILMLAPLVVALVYREPLRSVLAYLFPILALVGVGFLLQIPKTERESLYQKEGFALVALTWIVMALFGAVPFVISGDIPSYADAFFEITSGFTTTGASVVTDVTALSHSTLFWRSFSHWIGGMGILVFILIFIPESNDGSSMHLLRAESPGPQVGKIVSRMKVTTRILYLIYFALTVLELVLLLFDKPVAGYESDKLFYCLLTTFGSAGTGGFGVLPGSIELFSPYSQYVIAVFLLLYGVNFSLYYLLLIGNVKAALRSEELRAYLIIVFVAVTVIFVTLLLSTAALPSSYTTEAAFRHALFQTASIVTTTGYTTTDFALWPAAAQAMLLILMFMGAMAGSTGGGLKISRVVIAAKGSFVNVRKLINPRFVPKMKFEGKPLEEKTVNEVFAFFTVYLMLLLVVTLLLSFDPVNGTTVQIASDGGVYEQTHGLLTNLTATVSALSNIGPGLGAVGPYSGFGGYSAFSKIVLSVTMVFGRLEILPMLILFNPKTWKKI